MTAKEAVFIAATAPKLRVGYMHEGKKEYAQFQSGSFKLSVDDPKLVSFRAELDRMTGSARQMIKEVDMAKAEKIVAAHKQLAQSQSRAVAGTATSADSASRLLAQAKGANMALQAGANATVAAEVAVQMSQLKTEGPGLGNNELGIAQSEVKTGPGQTEAAAAATVKAGLQPVSAGTQAKPNATDLAGLVAAAAPAKS